jgi:hypothetical protein
MLWWQGHLFDFFEKYQGVFPLQFYEVACVSDDLES